MALIKGRRVCYFPSGGQSRQHGWLLRGVLQNGSFRLSVFRMGRMPPPTVRDEGGRSPSEPQSTRHGSALCDNDELRQRWLCALVFWAASVDRARSVCRLRSPPYRTKCRNDQTNAGAQRRHVHLNLSLIIFHFSHCTGAGAPDTQERTHAVFSLQPCSIVAALQCIVQTNAGAQRRHLHLNSTLHISLFTLERSDFAGAQRPELIPYPLTFIPFSSPHRSAATPLEPPWPFLSRFWPKMSAN